MGKISGLLIVLISLGVYFLLPLNNFLGIPESGLFGMKTPNLTLSYLFNACSNQIIGLMVPQCQTINFLSYVIFIIAFVGVILLIKGWVGT